MTNRLQILQIVTRNELRGAEVFAGQLSEALVGRGHAVTQAGLYRIRDDSQPLELPAVRVVELHGRVQGRIEWRPLRALKKLIAELQPDVIQANGFHALKYACLLKKLRRIHQPIVYRNISMASSWAGRRGKRAWGRWLCKSLSHVSSVSQAAADDFAAFYGLPSERVEVIRRGVEVPEEIDHAAARERLLREMTVTPTRYPEKQLTLPPGESASQGRRGLRTEPSASLQLDSPRGKVVQDSERYDLQSRGETNKPHLLCHVGGFTVEKNHRGLLVALERIRRKLPDSHLLLFGDGPLRGEIETLAETDSLAGHVHFMGFRDDARDLIAGCDLMLLTSRIEGIPGVVLEAAARCVPSVCTDVGSVAEFVEDGETGYLVEAGDMHPLADKTVQLLGDTATRERLGCNAKQRVREAYSMDRAVDQFEKLYQKVSGR